MTPVLVVLLGIALAGCAAFYIRSERAFEPLPRPVAPSPRSPNPKHLKLGIIGESWAAGRKLDEALERTLASYKITADVVSSGHPGAKTRQIYRNLLADDAVERSTRSLLRDGELDYLLILVGVNDAAGHIGKDYYAHHVTCIVRAAQERHVHPVVLELPEVGIEETPYGGILSALKRTTYRALFDGFEHDVIEDYRAALRERLSREDHVDVSLIDFSPFIENYHTSQHLYANPMYLTLDGWRLLGEYVGTELERIHRNRLRGLDE